MRTYILKDNFKNTKSIVNEKDLRDLYDKLMDEIIFNWKDCKDEKILRDLQKEKDNVYKCNMKSVISNIIDIDNYYEIKEVRK